MWVESYMMPEYRVVENLHQIEYYTLLSFYWIIKDCAYPLLAQTVVPFSLFCCAPKRPSAREPARPSIRRWVEGRIVSTVSSLTYVITISQWRGKPCCCWFIDVMCCKVPVRRRAHVKFMQYSTFTPIPITHHPQSPTLRHCTALQCASLLKKK